MKYDSITKSKDIHILAGAKRGRANFLLTLDKKHLLTKRAADFLKPVKVLTPKSVDFRAVSWYFLREV